jgi:hypothetical protein
MPTPGRDAPLPDMSRLVQLQAFNLTSANDTIHITAQATLVNPLPEGLEMTVPALPFVVPLPANGSTPAVPLAALHSAPLDAQTRPNLTLHLSGALLPLPAADGGGVLSLFVASGTVAARVVLPRGMRLALAVRRILPDVLVFNGSVLDAPGYANASVRGDEDVPPAPPLLDPLPEGAFAHIRPDA